MDGRRVDGAIRLAGDARQRFHDARGIGRVIDGETIELTWIEAAYLLDRGDLSAVDGLGRTAFFADPPDPTAITRWLVYRDLRERGYYVAPAYPPGEPPRTLAPSLHVKPRGADPTTDDIAHRVAVLPETATVTVGELTSMAMAIVDDEAEVTYLEGTNWEPDGSCSLPDCQPITGHVQGRWVHVTERSPLYERAFFGQPIGDNESMHVLTLLEATYLEDRNQLTIAAKSRSLDDAIDIDSPHFEATNHVYETLRDAGMVPRSGLKFGTTFRVYDSFDSVESPGHSSALVDVVDPDERTTPRSLSGAVRLATGVRKTYVMAIVAEGTIDWLALQRLTP